MGHTFGIDALAEDYYSLRTSKTSFKVIPKEGHSLKLEASIDHLKFVDEDKTLSENYPTAL